VIVDRWIPQAVEDLQVIYDFIARDSEHYAKLVVEGILAVVDTLERFPLIGRHIPEKPREDLRELIKTPTGSFIE
jgi:plasmid stabilization system protein ParE